MYNVATKEVWCHIFAKDTCDFEFWYILSKRNKVSHSFVCSIVSPPVQAWCHFHGYCLPASSMYTHTSCPSHIYPAALVIAYTCLAPPHRYHLYHFCTYHPVILSVITSCNQWHCNFHCNFLLIPLTFTSGPGKFATYFAKITNMLLKAKK